MGSTLKEKMAALPKERQEKIEARAEELIAEELTLHELRNKLNLTQAQMAELLGIRQEGISRLEKRTDMLLSTLRTYIESMGGDLELVVRFPDLPPVRLREVSDLRAKAEVTSEGRRKKSRRFLSHV